jgi:anaerobic magnesium-protoporphyrin IX monomethyl ester cyclase
MKTHRPINEIMYQEKEVDVVLIQPHLLSRELKHEQNVIVQKYWTTMHKHAVLLGDLPNEPNHGIFYIAATLLKNNYSVEALDFHALDRVLRKREGRKIEESDIIRAIKANKAKIYGISSKTVAIERAIQIAKIIKQLQPDAKIIMGGLHPTLHGRDLMEKCKGLLDFVVQGDGEHVMLEIMEYLKGNRTIKDISGILYITKNDQISENPRIPVTKINLDELPFPAYELICEEVLPVVPRVLSARGCPHDCAFCSITHYYQGKMGIRDPVKVVDEIEYMIKEFGIDFYCLGDLTFMANKKCCYSVCNEIIRRGLENVKWWCQTTVGRLDSNEVKLMKKAGCIQIALGIEGENQAILDLNNKPAKFIKAEEQCRIIKNEGVSVQTYWLIGMGTETVESAKNRVESICYFISQELTDAVHISVAVPFPGTPIWNDPTKYGYKGIIHENFGDYWMNCDELGYSKPALETESLSADHIYLFWQLALASATREFEKRYENVNDYEHYISEGMLNSLN